MSEWQPIATVPHGDDDRVLIYDPDFPCRPVCEARAKPDGRYYDPTYHEWDGVGATHWMPLPPPPKA